MRLLLCLAVLTLLSAGAEASLEVVSARWRPDANPYAKRQVWEGIWWAEGWKHEDQFYPMHFRPGGSLHVVLVETRQQLRNTAAKSVPVKLLRIDGTPIAEVTTTQKRAASVVWHSVEPEVVGPGEWTECIVRLRRAPKSATRLTFDANGEFDVTVPVKTPKLRIESVSFSPKADRVYVYVQTLDRSDPPEATLVLDGRRVASVQWTRGPKGSGLALAEARLSPAWAYASRHLVTVEDADGTRLAQQVRAWDNYYSIGLFGPPDKERAADAKAHGINTYYWPSSTAALHELGLNYIPAYYSDDQRERTLDRTGVLFYYNLDEPDAHDARYQEIPFMDRLGVTAMAETWPRMREQRMKAPGTLHMVLVNNTYKPLNWYVYGQIPDVLASDPYVPLGGEQLDRVPNSLSCARDACAPKPLVAVLWASGASNHKWGRRYPTPEEERMMVFYSVGCGAKGIGYFCDYDQKGDQEGLMAVSDSKPLWDEIARTNSDIGALAPLLAIGCPIPSVASAGDVWTRSVMCGRDSIVAVAVNTKHHIGFNTQNEYAWHIPLKNVAVDVPLPAHFRTWKVKEVRDGRMVPAKAEQTKTGLRIRLDTLDAARAFVIVSAQ